MDFITELGNRIRRLRLAAEMTQEELAERADLTAGFLSQVERGKTSISIDSLKSILDALNIHLSDFFRPTQTRVVFPKNESIELGREGVTSFKAMIPGTANRTMEPIRVVLAPGESITLVPFSGEQFGHILRGKLRIHYGSQKNTAGSGDSFYSEGQYEMILSNAGNSDTVFIWVTSPPYF